MKRNPAGFDEKFKIEFRGKSKVIALFGNFGATASNVSNHNEHTFHSNLHVDNSSWTH